MPSHALLLRLFLSPSFFTVHVALHYLLTYADNIGITYYLTHRLRELDISELHDVWGFICHLLVTRPTKSRALECFVVDIAQQSTHIAMITFWFMQATLQDMSKMRRSSHSFTICLNVLQKCHEIIFGDVPSSNSSPYANVDLPVKYLSLRQKLKTHCEPALFGIGIMLAGAIGMPQLVHFSGRIAIEQGRADEEGTGYRSVQDSGDCVSHNTVFTSKNSPEDADDDPEEHLDAATIQEEVVQSPVDGLQLGERSQATSVRLKGRRRTIGAAQTVPALPLHLQNMPRSRGSEDPLGQRDSEDTASPYRSSPSLPMTRTPLSSALNSADVLLEKYDIPLKVQLLRSHYCLSEVQFLLSLENISNRLLVVPKPARVSALRAELTALNHRLPAEVCMPLWCSSSDIPGESQHLPQPHHRIVRIPPGESVVLNSAERAPYLLLIEILDDDLDFDPSKRPNKDVLRKIIQKEQERKGASRDLIPFGIPPTSHSLPLKSHALHDSDVVRDASSAPAPVIIIPSTPTHSAVFSREDDEVDLVEQVYGAHKPLLSRPVDLSESIMLPPTPKNKELDMATWSRPPSIPLTTHSEHVFPTPQLPTLQTDRASLDFISSPPQRHIKNGSEYIESLSLDEYSERMRTAAIMLAQLNSNLLRESVTPITSSSAVERGQLQSTQTLSDDHRQSSQSRTKLHYSEAAVIRDRIMKEMLALEEERMARMRENRESNFAMGIGDMSGIMKSDEDEGIIRRELNKVDPSAVVFSESWAAKKSRIRHGSPYGHLANWDCVSVIIKTGGDLRQEQLAVQLIREFQRIWAEENCSCWVKHFRILITGGSSGLVETIKDAVSVHSIKKSEYAKRLAGGSLGHVTLLDHFKSTYGDPSSAKFARAQRNFAKSLAGYSIVTYLLQIKDRHNGNILLDRDGHLIHIDFGFILSNTPGNIGFEAAPFKLPAEYVQVLGGVDAPAFVEFKRLFREGFEAARKHCDRIITLVELMQKDSCLPCFTASGVQTANQLRERFQPTLTHSLVEDYITRLIDSSLGSHWTRLYDSYQYYSQSIL